MDKQKYGDKCPICGDEGYPVGEEYKEREYTVHYSCFNDHDWWETFEMIHVNTTTENFKKLKPSDLCPYCTSNELTDEDEIFGKKGHKETSEDEHLKIFKGLDRRAYLQDDESEYFEGKIFHCNFCNKSFMKVFRCSFSYSEAYNPED